MTTQTPTSTDATDTTDTTADAALKDRHRAMWASGHYDRVANDVIPVLGERLVASLGITSGERVLDVAAGTGNASIPAAGSSASRMTGTILSRSYLGPVIRLLIDLNGTNLHASVPSNDEVPAEGEKVTLGFAKDALHLMEPAS